MALEGIMELKPLLFLNFLLFLSGQEVHSLVDQTPAPKMCCLATATNQPSHLIMGRPLPLTTVSPTLYLNKFTTSVILFYGCKAGSTNSASHISMGREGSQTTQVLHCMVARSHISSLNFKVSVRFRVYLSRVG